MIVTARSRTGTAYLCVDAWMCVGVCEWQSASWVTAVGAHRRSHMHYRERACCHTLLPSIISQKKHQATTIAPPSCHTPPPFRPPKTKSHLPTRNPDGLVTSDECDGTRTTDGVYERPPSRTKRGRTFGERHEEVRAHRSALGRISSDARHTGRCRQPRGRNTKGGPPMRHTARACSCCWVLEAMSSLELPIRRVKCASKACSVFPSGTGGLSTR